MPKAKKVGDQWSVLVYLGRDSNGKKKYKRVSGYDKKVVEHEAAALAIRAQKTTLNPEKTVGQVLDDYIQIKNNLISPSTLRSYYSLRKHHYTDIADINVNDLRQSDIQKMINNEASKLSPKTVHNIYGFLTAALNEFYPDIHFRVKLHSKVKTEMQIPDSNIINEYLIATSGTELHKAIVLAAFLGLRRSEVCALLKSDINFQNKTIRINKAIVVDDTSSTVVKPPKSYVGNCTIVMPYFIIQEFIEICSDQVVNLTLFQITHQFTSINKRLGYNFRFHDLMHYNASVMLLLNVPDKYAQERIGHATNNMLKDVYQHTFDKKHLEIAAVMNNYFQKTFKI